MRLAKYDIIGSMAHIKMLVKIGLLEEAEEKKLRSELQRILSDVEEGNFTLSDDAEDIHSQIEAMLTETLGESGKKIHSGRSRNDQVLVDLKLFFKDEIRKIKTEALELFDLLQTLSEQYRSVLLPGYTYLQISIPSSLGLWFGAYAETLVDDMHTLVAAWRVANQNPPPALQAGYGSSFPLDREMDHAGTSISKPFSYKLGLPLRWGGGRASVSSLSHSIVCRHAEQLAADNCMYLLGQIMDLIPIPTS